MTKQEYFNELLQKVRALSVLQVISNEIPVYTERGTQWVQLTEADIDDILKSGRAKSIYYACCPFHGGGLGSFVIHADSQNYWYCFVDDFGGDGIDFYKRRYELPFKETVFRLAKQHSLISREEELLYYGKEIEVFSPSRKPVFISKTREEEQVPEHRASINLASNVYTLFPKIFGLSQKDRQYLLKKRNVPENALGDYFTYPSDTEKAAKILETYILKAYSLSVYKKDPGRLSPKERREFLDSAQKIHEKLKEVPGLCEKKADKSLQLTDLQGLGFLVKNDLKKALGINVRTSNENKRYVWLSSSWALKKPGFSGGASPGAPGGILFPGKIQEDTPIVITEGRFKAEAIRKANNIAIYVSGVGMWENVTDIISRVRGNRKSIFVMYDSDMMGNTAVHKHLSNLCRYLEKEGLFPILVLWRIRYGKGFDDLVENTGASYKRHIRYMSYENFESIYKKASEYVLAMMNLPPDTDKIPANRKRQYRQLMQNGVENLIWES